MLEYTMIAILVIIGIVIMGPYVLRSVNAHFKLWDDGVQDSYQENLRQAPLNDVPPINANCDCSQTPQNCGGPGLYCPANQREYDYQCSPLGCNGAAGASSCVDDPTCCTTPSSLGCGTIPIPASGVPTAGTCPTGFAASQTCVPSPASDPSNCYYGFQIYGFQCGATISDQCVPDASCAPSCQGVVSSDAVPCTNEPPANGVSLLQDVGVTYVNTPADCDPNQQCQYYQTCRAYIVNNTPCPAIYPPNTCGDYNESCWGSFIDKGALWIYPNQNGPYGNFASGNFTTTFSRLINIPVSGNYIIRFSVDNYGYVSIDGNKVYQILSCSSLYDDYQDTPITLTQGSHLLVL